jgi:hypothetical protein
MKESDRITRLGRDQARMLPKCDYISFGESLAGEPRHCEGMAFRRRYWIDGMLELKTRFSMISAIDKRRHRNISGAETQVDILRPFSNCFHRFLAGNPF